MANIREISGTCKCCDRLYCCILAKYYMLRDMFLILMVTGLLKEVSAKMEVMFLTRAAHVAFNRPPWAQGLMVLSSSEHAVINAGHAQGCWWD